MSHTPVLLKEVIQIFQECPRTEPTLFFDGTFGRGGHTRAVLEKFPQIKAVVMDRDLDAIRYGEAHFQNELKQERIRFVHDNYVNFNKHQLGEFDLMLVDLGVSSPQLDEAGRGFSFYHDGPLDMRMDQTQSTDAAVIVNEDSEEDLIEMFRELGEVQKPFRVVKAIVEDRKTKPFKTTRELASLIERVDGWRSKGHHPATRYFMALRMKVNRELESLEEALPQLMNGLKKGGRLVVLTFHSLEDRIVKNIFKNTTELGSPVNKKVIQASWNETKDNPRARSAKLRAFQRSLA